MQRLTTEIFRLNSILSNFPLQLNRSMTYQIVIALQAGNNRRSKDPHRRQVDPICSTENSAIPMNEPTKLIVIDSHLFIL